MRNLPPDTMKDLMANFEAEATYMVDYDDKMVIGVYMVPENFPNLKFIEVQGDWALAERL
jgi:hypothetical protein